MTTARDEPDDRLLTLAAALDAAGGREDAHALRNLLGQVAALRMTARGREAEAVSLRSENAYMRAEIARLLGIAGPEGGEGTDGL
jgi:hypothetical protein